MKLEKEVKIYNAYNYAYGNPLSSLSFEEQMENNCYKIGN